MKICKISLIRIHSRPLNTILLSGVFMIVSTLLLVLLGLHGRGEAQKQRYKETISGELVIRAGENSYGIAKEGYGFSENQISKLLGGDGVCLMNKTANASAYADSFTVKKESETGLKIQITNGLYDSMEDIPDLTIMGVLDSSKFNWFENHIYELTEGDPIEPKDDTDKTALISQGIAQNNQLKIGSKIQIHMENSKASVELTVKGIFSALSQGENASRTHPENRIIIPIRTFEAYEGQDKLYEATIHLDRASMTDVFLAKVKDSDQNSLKHARIIVNNYEYVKKSSILMGIQQYLKITMDALLLATFFILGMYLLYQNMTREREFKIFLSRGAARHKIAMQVLIEILIACILGNLAGLLLCVLLFPYGKQFLFIQSIQIQSLWDIVNRSNIAIVFGEELIIIFMGNLITFLNLLIKQHQSKEVI